MDVVTPVHGVVRAVGSLARWAVGAAMLAGCATAGVNPTGLTGGQVQCAEGPRQTLDCRGALQQYARDLKAEVTKLQFGLGLTTTKLAEVDAISSDLIEHYYQTCTLYNACLITREQYVARTERLQQVQLEVRRVVGNLPIGSQQNIQINPPLGGLGSSGSSPGAGLSSQSAEAPSPGGVQGQVAQPQDRLDAILNILRSGTRLVGPQSGAAPAPTPSVSAAPAAPPSGPPRSPGTRAAGAAQPDLDGSLRGLVVALRDDISRRTPQDSPRVAVGNFTEEGTPWVSPLGVFLQERVAHAVEAESLFRPAPPTRGLTASQVAAAGNPNEPRAQATLLGSDLVITGTYRPQSDRVLVTLTAVDTRGAEMARATGEIPRQAIPDVVAATPANAADAGRLLKSLERLGPEAQGAPRVFITTNRPGPGASFRLGEEIRYFVTSTADGYLYLFHVNAEQSVLRIFPNQYQRDARVGAGAAVEIPTPGAPFRFEASPPFGLETTFAIVTSTPLNEQDFQTVEVGFARPVRDVPSVVMSRGLAVKPARPATGAAPAAPTPEGAGRSSTVPSPDVAWSSVTVLIRP